LHMDDDVQHHGQAKPPSVASGSRTSTQVHHGNHPLQSVLFTAGEEAPPCMEDFERQCWHAALHGLPLTTVLAGRHWSFIVGREARALAERMPTWTDDQVTLAFKDPISINEWPTCCEGLRV
jgi:hypothetical protein